MLRRQFVSVAVRRVGLGVVGCCLTGCGTLLHSERSGRPHSNQIDWPIAALDGLGLLLFFVPGVVAFVVDFYTGAIYLPLEETYPDYGAPAGYLPPQPAASTYPMVPAPNPAPSAAVEQVDSARLQQLGLKRVIVPREQLQPQRIRQVVTEHVGHEVALDRDTRVSRLASLDQFLAPRRRSAGPHAEDAIKTG